jgi:alpha-L-rhamnosidase
MNHPFLGTIEDWFYNDLAGISPRAAGYRRVLIQPFFPKGLDHAQATVGTPQGKVTSSWRRQNGEVVLWVTIPAGIRAVVRLPAADGTPKVIRITGGSHTFHI